MKALKPLLLLTLADLPLVACAYDAEEYDVSDPRA